jgi:hypothetical protein
MAAVDLSADVPMSPQDMWDHVSDPSQTVSPAKGVSRLGVRLELGGRALFGPVGAAAARAVKGDVEKSLKQFIDLYG